MSVLITGCAGFIGSTLAERLVNQEIHVLGIDSFTDYYSKDIKQGNLKNLSSNAYFHFADGDMAEMDLPPLLEQVDCVFHTAGQPGVRGSWGGQFDTYVKNNILSTQRLMEGIKSLEKEIKVVYSSSSSIYGNVTELPITENALPRPYSPYGTTKLAGEHLCMLYNANYGIPVVSLRYFTVYGPRQRPDMAFHIFSKALVQGKPITILGDGTQTRDFTYVDDIVDANILAYQKDVSSAIVNLGGGCRISINEVMNLLEDITGKKPEVIRKERFEGDVKDTWADTTQAQKILGFMPKVDLKTGLAREYDWARSLYS